MISQIAAGIAATALASVAILSWTAIGSVAFRRFGAASAPTLPCSLLAGAATTGAALGILSLAGLVRPGALVVSLASLAILFVQRHFVKRDIGEALSALRLAIRELPVAKWLLYPLGAIAWVYAIAPPRDGDVMRYHLAHIRQIASDGAWKPIADITYAFPFAWTLNYLPFELLGLPQAAQLANLGLAVLVLITLLRLAPQPKDAALALLAALVFLAHPFILRTFTSALADAYAILAVTVVVGGILQLGREDNGAAVLLGFASWTGIGSRYQLVAVGIAATAIFVIHAARTHALKRLLPFSIGAASAIVLASPFYIANYFAFRNPVWPLFAGHSLAESSYSNTVASSFASAFAAPLDMRARVANALHLFTNADMVPLPLLLICLVAFTLWKGDSRHRYVALFAAMFLALWELMSPRLYPTHILPVLAVVPILLVETVSEFRQGTFAVRSARALMTAGIAGFAILSAFFAYDYARYALTGDSAAFHRYTWYYPTYEWANRATPRNSRFLVIVLSGHSYYLDRQYRRADPWLSAEVDWTSVASPASLDSLMSREGFQYVIFDDRNWGQFPGGAQMGDVIHGAMREGMLVPVHRSREPLYTSRVRRTSSRSDVYVLRRNPRR